ncbi:MAG: hypothetical protein GEV08_04780 [Acidimicrobiia bacterium]|nr:hypothetical protein [Acidimicrobiia bacterium]
MSAPSAAARRAVSATGAGPAAADGRARREIFESVAGIAEALEADAVRADALRRLPSTSVDALRGAGLLALKVPAELGGLEADPALQFEVFEQVAYHSAPAGWCCFIYADSAGLATARLPAAGLARYLSGRDVPVTCGGGGLRPGTLVTEDGGYRLTGRWGYGSGIHGAAWVLVPGHLAAGPGHRRQVRTCVVPKAALEVGDAWDVIGLRGTGSEDFAADDVYVPEEMTFSMAEPPERGGPLQRLGIAGYLGHAVPAVAVGVARRVLDEVTAMAATKSRGYTRRAPLAERSVFQSFLGEADQALEAVRALMLANSATLLEGVRRHGFSPPANEADVRAAGAFAVRTATRVVGDALRFAGGEAAQANHLVERSLRDLHMAGTHMLVSEAAYENHGQFLLGLAGADPLA